MHPGALAPGSTRAACSGVVGMRWHPGHSSARDDKRAESVTVTDLTKLTLAEAREGLREKQFSATELTQAFLDAIEAGNAAQRLRAADARASRWRRPRPATRGWPRARRGRSKACRSASRTSTAPRACARRPAPTSSTSFTPTYESTVTQNLWDAGAVMLGKLNNDEFAMGSSNETSCFGPVVNPWRRKGSNVALVPGGSSGGSSAAVAADLCLGATATDTGGSIRQPAAITGTVGIKPTYGRCSRWGIVAFASSLDQAGPIAKTVRDAAILLRHMASVDPKDFDLRRCAGARLRGGRRPERQGPQGRRAQGVPHRRHAAGDRGPLAAGHRLAEGGRRHHPRRLAAAHQVRAAGLLHRGAGRVLLQPRPLRRRALRPAQAGRAT